MDISIFTDKKKTPDDADLAESLGKTFSLWQTIKEYISEKNTALIEEWNYPGDKYGWSFRIKDKKSAIIYLLPRSKFFKAAFVFGQKATDEILKSKIREDIKRELGSARVYAEGRGIRIDIKDDSIIEDIKMLIDFKFVY